MFSRHVFLNLSCHGMVKIFGKYAGYQFNGLFVFHSIESTFSLLIYSLGQKETNFLREKYYVLEMIALYGFQTILLEISYFFCHSKIFTPQLTFLLNFYWIETELYSYEVLYIIFAQNTFHISLYSYKNIWFYKKNKR